MEYIQNKKFYKAFNKERNIFSSKEKAKVIADNCTISADTFEVNRFLTDLILDYCVKYFHNNQDKGSFIKNRPSTRTLMFISESYLANFYFMKNNFLPYYNKYYYHFYIKYNWESIANSYFKKIGYEKS
jgi:hypothetical protein